MTKCCCVRVCFLLGIWRKTPGASHYLDFLWEQQSRKAPCRHQAFGPKPARCVHRATNGCQVKKNYTWTRSLYSYTPKTYQCSTLYLTFTSHCSVTAKRETSGVVESIISSQCRPPAAGGVFTEHLLFCISWLFAINGNLLKHSKCFSNI